jgi:hypothetical protein
LLVFAVEGKSIFLARTEGTLLRMLGFPARERMPDLPSAEYRTASRAL